MMRVGDRVQLLTDPHGRPTGVVTSEASGPGLRRDLLAVKWDSGITEYVHRDELAYIFELNEEEGSDADSE